MYDMIVVGLGGMGSATLAHCAKRRKRVLGIEQYARGHDLGASAGRSRIIRKAYFEGAAYVPLLQRAYELWRELERESQSELLDLCGMLLVGRNDGALLRGAAGSAQTYRLALEALTHREMLQRYPSLRLLAAESGLFERDAGMIFPEKAVEAHLRVAERAGAELRYEARVCGYASRPDGIHVETDDGSVCSTHRLAVCAGPWLPRLAPEPDLPLRVQRNVQVWFAPTTDDYTRDRFPTFLLEREAMPAALYGFPDYGQGVKAAFHAYGDTTSAEDIDRTVRDADSSAIRTALEAFMPGSAGTFLSGKACMYTLTPDEHFILDRHPYDERIVVAGGFSGHGYKFCSVVGKSWPISRSTGRRAIPSTSFDSPGSSMSILRRAAGRGRIRFHTLRSRNRNNVAASEE